MRILVLGGTGAMGVHLVKLLTNRGDEVYVTSRSRRESECRNVHYIQGDAHDLTFIKSLLEEKYDAILDFMVYSTDEFKGRAQQFLLSTGQYIYFSSSRVYANSIAALIEESERLLDSSNDKDYLSTDEYALAKARQENILIDNKESNWTIIRPYITYSNERLQLGIYEKEDWLYRALKGKPIVFSKDVAEKETTLTFGLDVAKAITKLIGNPKAYGGTYHITSDESLKWIDVLEIYCKAIKKVTGVHPKVFMTDVSIDGKKSAQLNLDRLYDRKFDNNKIRQIAGDDFISFSVENGLEKCVIEFIEQKRNFKQINWQREAQKDRLTKSKTSFSEIDGQSNKLKYIVFRYIPVIAKFQKITKSVIFK